jgi:hypothetical protein
MKYFILKANHLLFFWYYKRIPVFFNQWNILKSLSLLTQNYEHNKFIINQKEEVISKAIEIERDLNTEIRTLIFKLNE